jgi:hypothetical protein
MMRRRHHAEDQRRQKSGQGAEIASAKDIRTLLAKGTSGEMLLWMLGSASKRNHIVCVPFVTASRSAERLRPSQCKTNESVLGSCDEYADVYGPEVLSQLRRFNWGYELAPWRMGGHHHGGPGKPSVDPAILFERTVRLGEQDTAFEKAGIGLLCFDDSQNDDYGMASRGAAKRTRFAKER